MQKSERKHLGPNVRSQPHTWFALSLLQAFPMLLSLARPPLCPPSSSESSCEMPPPKSPPVSSLPIGSTTEQTLTADLLLLTLEHEPHEGPGLLQTDGRRDLAILVSTD